LTYGSVSRKRLNPGENRLHGTVIGELLRKTEGGGGRPNINDLDERQKAVQEPGGATTGGKRVEPSFVWHGVIEKELKRNGRDGNQACGAGEHPF